MLFINCYSQSGWVWKSPYPQGNSINKIFTTPSGKLYGICDYGTIITSTNGGVNWIFTNKMLGLKDDFVSYFVNSENTIFIGSSAGKIIKTTNAGSNWNIIYDFNASQLASGIYFYRMTAGEFTQTKKMILLK